MESSRALHFVFKVGNRPETVKFYKNVLGMKFLRHEEFEEGCKATCNGPYDGKWSKSMVGYGAENSHFVVELTYNYGIGSYRLGNDFLGITLQSSEILNRALKENYKVQSEGSSKFLLSPDGHKFNIIDKASNGDPVKKVSLAVSNLRKSLDYWSRLCGMRVFDQQNSSAELAFSSNQTMLELVDIGQTIDHATAFGRIAFACPTPQLPVIESKMKEEKQTIRTSLVKLDTPGKATVQVVILADPDGHEICFVGDKEFYQLAQIDPKSDELLNKAIELDKSDEWFSKKGRKKAEAS